MLSKSQILILLFLSFLILLYVVVRSVQLPFTHDESGTYIHFYETNLFDCFFTASDECWLSANNHFLNTLLMQASGKLLGDKEWTLRLPNILAYVLYAASSILIISLLTRKKHLAVLGFSLLNFNPYMNDFFSLSRGYGLSLGFTLFSIFLLICYYKNRKDYFVLLSFISAALSVLSNFASLNIYLSIWVSYFIIESAYGIKQAVFRQIIPLAVTIILATAIYTPITYLQGKGEFYAGADSLYETFYFLINNSLYSQPYATNAAIIVLLAAISLMVISGIYMGISGLPKLNSRNEISLSAKSHFFIASIFLTSLLIMIIQHYAISSKYLSNRTALIYIVLAGLMIFFLLYHLDNYMPKSIKAASLLLSTIFIIHLGLSGRFNTIKEWHYDRYTKDMLLYMNEIHAAGDSVSLSIHWTFHPTTNFYKKLYNLDFLELPEYDRDELQPIGADYYYTYKRQYDNKLHDHYEIEKVFGGFGYFLKRKDDKPDLKTLPL